jgi:hypothetical protein
MKHTNHKEMLMKPWTNLYMLKVASMFCTRIVEWSLTFRTVVFYPQKSALKTRTCKEVEDISIYKKKKGGSKKTPYQDQDCLPNATVFL